MADEIVPVPGAWAWLEACPIPPIRELEALFTEPEPGAPGEPS